jgi:glycosyltransferase involved in cell wall biosynthesis
MNVCVITYSNSKAFVVPLSNLGSVLQEQGALWLIVPDGNITRSKINVPDSNVIKIANNKSSNALKRVFNQLNAEVMTTIEIIRLKDEFDACLIFMEGCIFVPVLISKLLHKRTIILLPSNIISHLSNSFVNSVRKLLSKITLIIVDTLVVYSPSLIVQWDLEPYCYKIHIAHEHFLDFNVFTVTVPLPDRPHLIGYIGRLSAEKGVYHFAQALPAILNDRQDLRVLIGGEGQLREMIVASLQEEGVTACVDLPGWISHDDLPKYLNQLRLLVLPSYTEGLPNIMLEAMACGTPVLATPVGAIPDVIIDGKTGFIMVNNSPECIEENVIRALNSPDLEQIAEAGRQFVKKNFTFEKTMEGWRRVLQNSG